MVSASARKRARNSRIVFARQNDLQGAKAVEPGLAGLVDDTHPAAAQLGQDLDARDIQKEVRRRTLGRRRPRAVRSRL